MNKLELVQYIGSEVCEECGDNADCGIPVDECSRIASATDALDRWLYETEINDA